MSPLLPLEDFLPDIVSSERSEGEIKVLRALCDLPAPSESIRPDAILCCRLLQRCILNPVCCLTALPWWIATLALTSQRLECGPHGDALQRVPLCNERQTGSHLPSECLSWDAEMTCCPLKFAESCASTELSVAHWPSIVYACCCASKKLVFGM